MTTKHDVLFAWANPVAGAGKLADHTWVTSFPEPFACVLGGPPHHYWYCWGDCHPAGPGTTARALGNASGALAVARCIGEPDRKDNRPFSPTVAGINFYGVDGVCHQVANRILFATSGPGTDPLTVHGAHGYEVSVFAFGSYGGSESEWAQRLGQCGGSRSAPLKKGRDDLARLIGERVGAAGAESLTAPVREQRMLLSKGCASLERDIKAGRVSGVQFASAMNDAINERLLALAKELGPEAYQAVFRAFPEERVDVVDPRIAEAAYAQFAANSASHRDVRPRVEKAPPPRGPRKPIQRAKAVRKAATRKAVKRKAYGKKPRAAKKAFKMTTTKG